MNTTAPSHVAFYVYNWVNTLFVSQHYRSSHFICLSTSLENSFLPGDGLQEKTKSLDYFERRMEALCNGPIVFLDEKNIIWREVFTPMWARLPLHNYEIAKHSCSACTANKNTLQNLTCHPDKPDAHPTVAVNAFVEPIVCFAHFAFVRNPTFEILFFCLKSTGMFDLEPCVYIQQTFLSPSNLTLLSSFPCILAFLGNERTSSY